MQFTADQVWGLAVAADRINGGYFKDAQFADDHVTVLRKANKTMVKQWLRDQDFQQMSEADVIKGREVRHYFNGFLLKELSGKINDFERQALRIAQMDEFTGRNMLEFAVISCLPAAMIREQVRNDLARDVRQSTPLAGNVGDRIVADLEVVKSYFNQNYGKYRVTGRIGESYVDFWASEAYEGTVRIKAKIKAQRGDKTTQIHYVKRVG